MSDDSDKIIAIGSWGSWPYYELHSCGKLVQINMTAKSREERRLYVMLPRDIYKGMVDSWIDAQASKNGKADKLLEKTRQVFEEFYAKK